MSTVRVSGGVGDLAADLARIAKEAPVLLQGVVREGVKTGNTVAKDFARVSSRQHAKLYPGTFSSEMHPRAGYLYSGEYGPVARGQGLLAPILEHGSRNNPAHGDLAKSADLIGPALHRGVGDALDRLFW